MEGAKGVASLVYYKSAGRSMVFSVVTYLLTAIIFGISVDVKVPPVRKLTVEE